MSDEQLVALIREGGNARDKALSYIYLKWRGKAARILIRKGADPEKAKDIIQEAIIIVDYQIRRPSFKLTGKLENFFINTCKNLLIAPRRKMDQITFYTNDDKKYEKLSEDNQELKMLSESCQQIISIYLERLDEKCQKALEFYAEGYKHEVIALRMNMPTPGAAKNKVYTCMLKLKELTSLNSNLKECLKFV